MTILTLLIGLVILGMVLLGIYFWLNPQVARRLPVTTMIGGIAFNLLIFAGGIVAALVFGINEAMAAETASGPVSEISLGHGLALIGIGLPTAFATVAAGIAVSSVGSASLAVITEKPEMFGRTLVYLGLAEGIAIYGLVVSILLLGKI